MSLTDMLFTSNQPLLRAANSFAPKILENLRKVYLFGNEFMTPVERRRKFKLGICLALWPVLVASFTPAVYSNRLPVAVFCLAAIMSEGAAAWLFSATYRRRIDRKRDRLTSWSFVGAAAAGVCTLAFLIAALANVM